jgi:hypothetical protein
MRVLTLGATLNVLSIALTLGFAGGAVAGTLRPPAGAAQAASAPAAAPAPEAAEPASGAGPFGVGELVRTSVGAMRVTDVTTFAAVSPARVEVTVRLTNDTAAAVHFTPAALGLRTAAPGGTPAQAATGPTGVAVSDATSDPTNDAGSDLPPGGTVEETVDFKAAGTGLVLVLPGGAPVTLS